MAPWKGKAAVRRRQQQQWQASRESLARLLKERKTYARCQACVSRKALANRQTLPTPPGPCGSGPAPTSKPAARTDLRPFQPKAPTLITRFHTPHHVEVVHGHDVEQVQVVLKTKRVLRMKRTATAATRVSAVRGVLLRESLGHATRPRPVLAAGLAASPRSPPPRRPLRPRTSSHFMLFTSESSAWSTCDGWMDDGGGMRVGRGCERSTWSRTGELQTEARTQCGPAPRSPYPLRPRPLHPPFPCPPSPPALRTRPRFWSCTKMRSATLRPEAVVKDRSFMASLPATWAVAGWGWGVTGKRGKAVGE
jgi:hypothetical protein